MYLIDESFGRLASCLRRKFVDFVLLFVPNFDLLTDPEDESSYLGWRGIWHKEEILQEIETDDKYIVLPFRKQDVMRMHKNQEYSFWTADEIDFSRDRRDFNKLPENQRIFFKHILAFFALSDGIVSENLANRFGTEMKDPEICRFYRFQCAMEDIHAEVYATAIQAIVPDEKERAELFNANLYTPGLQEKVAWIKRWVDDQSCFAKRLIAFAIVEGIFFCGSFASIFWLKKRGLMPGFTLSNEYISRDEGLHRNFACLVFTNHLVARPSVRYVHVLVEDAVRVENLFFSQALDGNNVGEINVDTMLDYIKLCANNFLLELNYPTLYPDTKNPFEFTKQLSIDGKTNFFERRSSEYKKSSCRRAFNIGRKDDAATFEEMCFDFEDRTEF